MEDGVAFWITMIGFGLILVMAQTILLLVTRYKRCASDEILVVYGRVEGGRSSKCIHGGGTLVWPLIQDYNKLSLIPMSIEIPLDDAISCLLYTSPSPRDGLLSRMPSSA